MGKRILGYTKGIPGIKINVDTDAEAAAMVDFLSNGQLVFSEESDTAFFKNSNSSVQNIYQTSLVQGTYSTTLQYAVNTEYPSETITSNLAFTLGSNLVYGVYNIHKLNFNGTASLTLPTPHVIENGSFVNGGVPISGDYELITWWDIDNKIHANLNPVTTAATKTNLKSVIMSGDDFISIEDAAHDFKDGATDNPFSFEFWLKWTDLDTAVSYWIMDRVDRLTDTIGGWRLYKQAGTNGITFTIRKDGSNYMVAKTDTAVFVLNTWAQCIVTYDGSKADTGMTVYINGAGASGFFRSTTGTYDGISADPANARSVIATANTARPKSKFKANIHRVFNKELTLTEVQELYNSGVPILGAAFSDESSIINSFRFEDSLTDDEGNGVATGDGTITYDTDIPT